MNICKFISSLLQSLIILLWVSCDNNQVVYTGESELVQSPLGVLKTDTINNEYSIEIPKTWTVKSVSNEAVKILNTSVVDNAANNYAENIYIEKVSKGLPYKTDTLVFKKDSMQINRHVDLEQFGKQYVNGFLTAYNEVKIIEIGETRINKVVAKQYLFGYKDVAASQEQLKALVYLIPSGIADVYVVQCTESSSSFVRARNIFENAINNFLFL